MVFLVVIEGESEIRQVKSYVVSYNSGTNNIRICGDDNCTYLISDVSSSVWDSIMYDMQKRYNMPCERLLDYTAKICE